MMMWRPDSPSDHRELRRVRLPGRDALRTRQQFERELAAVHWQQGALPPRALLLVRRVALKAGARLAARLSDSLREHAQTARRPWLHGEAMAAPAVWFADEAELAACLVRDWLHGRTRQAWWWRVVLCGMPVGEWLRRHVLERGACLVTVLEQLAPGDDAIAWLAKLDDGTADAAARTVAATYGLEPAVIEASAPFRVLDGVMTEARAAAMDPPAATAAGPPHPAVARLLRAVPELRDPRLRAPAARIWALARVALREPTWLRSPAFTEAMQRWVRGRALEAVASPVASHERAGTEPSQIAPGAARRLDRTTVEAAKATPPKRRSRCPDALLRAGPARLASAAGAGPAFESVPLPPSPLAFIPADEPIRHEPECDASQPGPGDAPRTPPPPPAAAFAGTSASPVRPGKHLAGGLARSARDSLTTTSSDFGGLFYLLNAALALGLYGDFTSPRKPGIALSPWDWLALVGRAWLGPVFERDPVWALLRRLAGRRDGDPPGIGYTAPAQWAIGEDWLASWGAIEALRYHATHTRLRLRHEAGFVLFDVPRDAMLTPAAQARALCADNRWLQAARIERAPSAEAPKRPRGRTARWMNWLLPFLHARLARSLGVAEGDGELPILLCRHDAELRCTATTLDVHLALATLPLEIRFAGLDRDPGWIPAAGRAVYFRFS